MLQNVFVMFTFEKHVFHLFNVFICIYLFNVFIFIYLFKVFICIYLFHVFICIYLFNVFICIYLFNVFICIYLFNVFILWILCDRLKCCRYIEVLTRTALQIVFGFYKNNVVT